VLGIEHGKTHLSRPGGVRDVFNFGVSGDRARLRGVEHPCVRDSHRTVRAQRQAAIEAAEPMALLEFKARPIKPVAIDPVEPAAGISDAKHEQVLARPRGGAQIAFEGQLFHDGVAHELFVQIDLDALARATDMEQEASADQRSRNFQLPPPPGNAIVGAVFHLVVGRLELVFVVVGTEARHAPRELLHCGRQHDLAARLATQLRPTAGRWIGRKLREVHFGRQIDAILLPLGERIQPHPPPGVGNDNVIEARPSLVQSAHGGDLILRPEKIADAQHHSGADGSGRTQKSSSVHAVDFFQRNVAGHG
jgi:hypothetical protein